jgi:uncharacterized protein (TIGR03067 family)
MLRLLHRLTIVGVLIANIAVAEDANDEASQKDRKRIEGTWQITALEIGGNKSKDEDVKKLTVVNGKDGAWSVRTEGKEISRGTSTFNPTQNPKNIDFTPTEGGGKGEQFLGIYELRKNTRKLCFAPSGKDRPTEFSSTPENQHVFVVFERGK